VPGIAKKNRPLTPEYFAEIKECFGPKPARWAQHKRGDSSAGKAWLGGNCQCKFLIGEARQRIFKLGSLKSLKDEDLADSEDVPEPKELADDAITKVRAALKDPSAVIAATEHGNRDVKGDRE